jgi:hypothetical protein
MTSTAFANSIALLLPIGLEITALLVGSYAIFFTPPRRVISASRRSLVVGLALIAVTLLLALILLPEHGTSDENIFLRWTEQVSRVGIVEAYRADRSGAFNPNIMQGRDYPPLMYVLLYGAARLAQTLSLTPLLGLKLLLAIFVGLSCLIFWVWTRHPLALALLALLLLVEAMVFGYLDVLFTPMFLLALIAWQKERYAVGVILYGIACLVKWQPLILAPFVVAYIVWNASAHTWVGHIRWQRLFFAVLLPAAIELGLLLLVFGAAPFVSIQAATENTQLSGQALNADWVLTALLRMFDPQQFGGLHHDLTRVIKTLDWRILLGPKILFATFYATALGVMLRGPHSFLRWVKFALLGYLAYFIFNTGVHENHLYLASVLGIVLWHLAPEMNRLALVWSTLCWVNIQLFYDPTGHRLNARRLVEGMDPALPLAILVTLFFVYFFVRMLRDDGVRFALPHAARLKRRAAP